MRILTSATPLLAALTALNSAALSQPKPFEGLTLFNTFDSETAYLIELDGTVAHSWTGEGGPAMTPHLLPDGTLVRPAVVDNPFIQANGGGGRVQRIGWDGTVEWDFLYSSEDHLQHHDIVPMPNGNVLLVAWERKSHDEVIAMGHVSAVGELWPTEIVEVQPDGPTGGIIVWEWHLWDHLIQDVDPAKPNYGVVADHPELLDVNYLDVNEGDWIHVNSIDYNPQLDQIIFSSQFLCEIFIIDHSTTTEEAAGHTGGRYGMGGDFLYRWGNPQTYDRGGPEDQHFFGCHSANWIDPGLPGEGNLIVFNNGNRPGDDDDYSSVEELVLPILPDGSYQLKDDAAFGPAEPAWLYDDPATFYGPFISGASRLPNGNTLVCEGPTGYLFEVTASGDTVWDHSCGGYVMRGYRYGPDYLEVPCAADVTGDGTVDVLDLLEVLAQWDTSGRGGADITGDGVVDVLDLLEVLAAWQRCGSEA